MKAARVEARRAMSTYTFAAVEARKLAGEMVPMDASQAGEGKLAFTLRRPIGVVGAISPFNFPLNLRRAQARAGARGRLRGRAEAGEPDAPLGAAARRARDRGRSSTRLAERPRRPASEIGDVFDRGRARQGAHLHRLGSGRLEAGRARTQEAGSSSSSATRRP